MNRAKVLTRQDAFDIIEMGYANLDGTHLRISIEETINDILDQLPLKLQTTSGD